MTFCLLESGALTAADIRTLVSCHITDSVQKVGAENGRHEASKVLERLDLVSIERRDLASRFEGEVVCAFVTPAGRRASRAG